MVVQQPGAVADSCPSGLSDVNAGSGGISLEMKEMNLSEREAFDHLIRPEDNYSANKTYWADLPLVQRTKFVLDLDAREVRKEFGGFWRLFKSDPLAPLAYYFRNMVLPGAGLGLEGYVACLSCFSPLMPLRI